MLKRILLIAGVILLYSLPLHAQYTKYKLTPEERKLTNEAGRRGRWDIPGEWDKFVWRVKHIKNPENRIEIALNDSSLNGRISRQLNALEICLLNPHTFFDDFYVNFPLLFVVAFWIVYLLFLFFRNLRRT